MNVQDGITTGTDPMTLTAEVARERERIVEQTRASHTIRGEKAGVGADEFRAAVVGAGAETSIAAGLEYGDPAENAREQAQMEQFAREGRALLDQDADERAELDAFRQDAAYVSAVEHLEGTDAETDDEYNRSQAIGWSLLGEIPSGRERALAEGYAFEEDAPRLDALAAAADQLLRDAAHNEAETRQTASLALERVNTRQRLAAQHGQGWVEQAEGRAIASGADLSSMSGQDFEAHLRTAAVFTGEDHRAHAVARMKAALLGEPTGDVMSGLTMLSANGEHVPVQPRGEIYVRPNYERAIERKLGGRYEDSAAGIRAGVGYDDPKTAEYNAVQSEAGKLFAAARASAER
jgi:hypothetical protein